MIIVHGDNQLASRQFFLAKKNEVKKQGQNIVDLAGDSLSLPELSSALSSTTLLGESNAVFVEGFFSRRPSNEKKAIVEYLKQNPQANIFFWESKDISTQLTTHNPLHIHKHDLPKHIFTFIDNWSLSTLRLALSTTEPEQIMAMLAKRIHDLILVKDARGKFPSWQVTKLKSQANKFTLLQLTTYNLQLLEIDHRQKTGQTAMDLGAALELWLIKNVK